MDIPSSQYDIRSNGGRAILVRWFARFRRPHLSLGLYPLVELHTTSCRLYFLNKYDRCVLLYFRSPFDSSIASGGGKGSPVLELGIPATGVICQKVQTNYLSGSKNVWLPGHWPPGPGWPSSGLAIEKKWKSSYTETTIEPLKIVGLIGYEKGLIPSDIFGRSGRDPSELK